MSDRYFVGDTDNDWNDTNNWSSNSGGIGGAGVPNSGDKAIFDSNSPNCVVDSGYNPEINALELTSGFGNTLDFNDQNIIINATSSMSGGTLNLGAGAFTIKGSWTYSGGTINRETSTVILASELTITGSMSLYNLTFDTNIGYYKTITIESSTILTVLGTLRFEDQDGIYINGGEIQAKGDIVIANSEPYDGSTKVFTKPMNQERTNVSRRSNRVRRTKITPANSMDQSPHTAPLTGSAGKVSPSPL